jgi:deoxycitidine kinase/deoxyguanosine kinase
MNPTDIIYSIFILIILSIFIYIVKIIIKTKISKMEKIKVVLVEGNIGAGKSTLLNILNNNFNHSITIVQEPVDQWKEKGTIKSYYKNPKRWGFTFQVHAIVTRFKKIYKTLQSLSSGDIIIIERSGVADRYCFVDTMKEEGYINDMEISVFDELYFDVLHKLYDNKKLDVYVIYLKTSPEECQKRIIKRDRVEEKNAIPLDYLLKIDYKHKNSLMNIFRGKYGDEKILELDSNIDYISNITNQCKMIDKIKKFIKI